MVWMWYRIEVEIGELGRCFLYAEENGERWCKCYRLVQHDGLLPLRLEGVSAELTG